MTKTWQLFVDRLPLKGSWNMAVDEYLLGRLKDEPATCLSLGLRKMDLQPELAGAPPEDYKRGALPCFSYPGRDELQASGKKLVGSAQKRTGKKFLQHGSILLEHDEAFLRAVSRLPDEVDRMRMTSLSELLGRPVSFSWAVERLLEGFAEFFGVAFERLSFTPEEREAIRRLQRQKYEDPDWTFRQLTGPMP
jgi:lipoate-protein ligase A